MRTKLLAMLLAVTCLMGLTACDKNDAKQTSQVSSTPEVQSSVSAPAASTPTQTEPKQETQTEIEEVSISDARRVVSESLDMDTYQVLDGNTNLQIDGQGYYVFIVAQKSDNKAVGQIAVNKTTGEKFNYKGENTLEDYSNFQLYDETTDMVASWEGVFTDGTQTLELIPMDSHSFEYLLGDITGVAQGTGNTATDESQNITFTYGADGTITVSGAVNGVFSPNI